MQATRLIRTATSMLRAERLVFTDGFRLGWHPTNGHHPLLDGYAGAYRHRSIGQPYRTRCRRDSKGTSAADSGATRNTVIKHSSGKHAKSCPRMGAHIIPAMPGFYHRPESIEDLVDFIVERVMDQLGCNNPDALRWGGGQ